MNMWLNDCVTLAIHENYKTYEYMYFSYITQVKYMTLLPSYLLPRFPKKMFRRFPNIMPKFPKVVLKSFHEWLKMLGWFPIVAKDVLRFLKTAKISQRVKETLTGTITIVHRTCCRHETKCQLAGLLTFLPSTVRWKEPNVQMHGTELGA